jgi:hypothetical protein
VPIDVSNKTRVVNSVEHNVNFLLKVIGVSEGGEVIRISYKGGRMRSDEGSSF